MTETEAIAREEVEKSTAAIRAIDELIGNPVFQGFASRVETMADEWAESVLEGNLDAVERENLRLRRIGLLSGLRSLKSDREGHASILRGHGIDV
jgi:hypothetical protein